MVVGSLWNDGFKLVWGLKKDNRRRLLVKKWLFK